jgi:signal transduction histidine kinase
MSEEGRTPHAAPGASGAEIREAQLDRARAIDHDLRTPIGTIASAVALLRARPEAFHQDACDIIERQVERLTGIVHALHQLVEEMGGTPTPPER